MAHTKFSNYTTEELLSLIDEKRAQSPLVDELATRLEASVASNVLEDSNHRVHCPVCEAALEADYDTGNSMFTIKVEG